MTDDKPTRRDLMKPVQLLGLAFGSAVFAGVVTLVAMGFFQQRAAEHVAAALQLALIFAGVTFIVVLLVVSLLLLAIDPADVKKTIDRPVLLPDPEPASGEATSAGTDPDAAASGGPKA